MTYRINKFDGSVLTDVVDGTIDQITTDLTLVGSDVSGYGEVINENFVHLLENFSSTQVPPNPITGQLWYDLAESVLKIYTGTQFIKVSGTILESDSTTLATNPGDIWIKSDKGQLFFNDGTSMKLAGPLYTMDQGKSGFEVKTINGTGLLSGTTNDYTVVLLWVSATLVGFISQDAFTMTNIGSIPTYTGAKVNPGITLLNPNPTTTLISTMYTESIQLYKDFNYDTNIEIRNEGANLSIDVIVDPANEANTGNIIVNGAKIRSVGMPADLLDAVNVQYSKIYHSTTQTNNNLIINELNILAPPSEYIDGVQAHVYCSAVTPSPVRRKYQINEGTWTGPIG